MDGVRAKLRQAILYIERINYLLPLHRQLTLMGTSKNSCLSRAVRI